MFIQLLLILIFLSIWFTDNHSRVIYLWQILLLNATGVVYLIISLQSFESLIYNLSWISIQFVFAFSYSKLLRKRLDDLIGSGDWLYLLSLTYFFSPPAFVAFVTSGLIICIIVHVAQSTANASIPLAGNLSLWGVLMIGFHYPINEVFSEFKLAF